MSYARKFRIFFVLVPLILCKCRRQFRIFFVLVPLILFQFFCKLLPHHHYHLHLLRHHRTKTTCHRCVKNRCYFTEWCWTSRRDSRMSLNYMLSSLKSFTLFTGIICITYLLYHLMFPIMAKLSFILSQESEGFYLPLYLFRIVALTLRCIITKYHYIDSFIQFHYIF